ncbi:MAG: hypothetical protein ACLRW2_06860 [Parasutterella excrementihominis]
MSNPEMKGARILRFHTSDKVFHSINAICWYALVITGAIVYFGHWMGDISDETANLMMVWHLWLGALFTLNFVGYVLFAPERFCRDPQEPLSGTKTPLCGSETSAAIRVVLQDSFRTG